MASNLHEELMAAGFTPVPIPVEGVVAWTGWRAPEDDMPEQPYLVDCLNCVGEGYVNVCPDDLCLSRDECMHGDMEVVCEACNGFGATEGREEAGC